MRHLFAGFLFVAVAHAQTTPPSISDDDLEKGMRLCRTHVVPPAPRPYVRGLDGQVTIGPRQPPTFTWSPGWESCGALLQEQVRRKAAAKSQEPQQQQSINDIAKQLAPSK